MFKRRQRALPFTVLAAQVEGDGSRAAKRIHRAARFEGKNGLALLYAVARHGPAKHRVAAVQTALADPWGQSLRTPAEKVLEEAKAAAALQGK